VNTFAEVTDRERVFQLAIIASPACYHAEQVIALLQAEVSISCEKPMATKSSDCIAMIEAAKRNEQVLAVGMLRRYFPATQFIRQMIQELSLGNVKSFHCSEGNLFSWPAKSTSFFQKEHAGGGVLIDVGVHALDLLHWWLGQPEEVFYEDDAMGGVEANCRLKLKYMNGVWGTLRLSRDTRVSNRYSFNCENGSINWTVPEISAVSLSFRGSEFALEGKLRDTCAGLLTGNRSTDTLDMQQILVRQVNNILAAMQGKEELAVSGEEASKSIALVERCYERRGLIQMGWLTESELSNARRIASAF
jgi:predicted dehydrogenase